MAFKQFKINFVKNKEKKKTLKHFQSKMTSFQLTHKIILKFTNFIIKCRKIKYLANCALHLRSLPVRYL